MNATKLQLEEVLAAAESGEGIGFCVRCGSEHAECEPDARNYACQDCGLATVFGAEEILIHAGMDTGTVNPNWFQEAPAEGEP